MSSSSSSQNAPLFLDVDKKNGKISLNSRIFRFQLNRIESKESEIIEVDLYSLLHVGDISYYDEIESLTTKKSYENVLYELIVDDVNTEFVDPIATNNTILSNFKKRRLTREIRSPNLELLSQQYGFESQLCLNFHEKTHFFIADLCPSIIRSMEAERKDIINSRFRSNLFGGRGNGQQLLKTFFLSDTWFITILRLLSWLIPAPELTCSLLDWSRTSSPNKAGGVPVETLLAIVQNLIPYKTGGSLKEAKKIAFAQEILSGVVDSGAFGGESRSDTEVLVNARNDEVIRVLSGFIHEIKQTRGSAGSAAEAVKVHRIAILYGAFHMCDLRAKMINIGFEPMTIPPSSRQSLKAWSMSFPPILSTSDSNSNIYSNSISDGDKDKDSAVKIDDVVPLVTFGLLYLFLGAVDWYILLDVITECGKQIASASASASAIATVFPSTSTTATSQSSAAVDIASNIVFLLGYIYLYVQRHAQLLRKTQSLGVVWDKSMYD